MILFLLLLGCASSSRLISDYQNKIEKENFKERTSEETTSAQTLLNPSVAQLKSPPVLLVLIDGLGAKAYLEASKAGDLTNINYFFKTNRRISMSDGELGSSQKSNFYLGMTQFPSLTFPNIASILMHKPISEHWVAHNKLYCSNEEWQPNHKELVNLELPTGVRKLNRSIESHLIFDELKSNNKHSVSFAHSFYSGTDAKLKVDTETGIYYLSNDISSVDEKALTALSDFLIETPYEKLPEFIFVHLIGYDSLAHEHGSKSLKAKNYLKFLDRRLKPILAQVDQYENKHKKIITLMTSDHGFVDPQHKVSLEEKIEKKYEDIVITNEGRLLSLYFKKGATRSELDSVAQQTVAEKGVGFVAYRHLNELFIYNKKQILNISYRTHKCDETPYQISLKLADSPASDWYCPQLIDQYFQYHNYPQFFNLLTHYFESPGHSDLLIVAEDAFGFNLTEKGEHGGFSTGEIYVPILMKNASVMIPASAVTSSFLGNQVQSKSPVLFNYQLLKFLVPRTP